MKRGALGAADVHAVTRQQPVHLSPANIADMQFGLEILRAGPLKQKAAAAIRRLRRKPQLRIAAKTAEVLASAATHEGPPLWGWTDMRLGNHEASPDVAHNWAIKSLTVTQPRRG